MSEEAGEDKHQLLSHCGLTMGLWSDMFRQFGRPWKMPNIVKHLMFSWRAKERERKRKGRAWTIVLLALMRIV